MAISLASHLINSGSSSSVATVARNSLDRVHEELNKGNKMVFKLELNSSLKAVETKRAKGVVKLESTISALGGIAYLKTAFTKFGSMFTDVSLLPKIKNESENWVDKDNFLALALLSQGKNELTAEQIAENKFCADFGKQPKHVSTSELEETLVSKAVLKKAISGLLRSSGEEDATASEWIESGNQDAKLYFNDLENYISMQDVRESPGLITIYFTFWNSDVKAIVAPGKKPVSMPNGSMAIVWYLKPLAVTFESGKTTSIKRPVRVLDANRSQAFENVFVDLLAEPKAKTAIEVVPSSFFEEISAYNLANVKTGSKGHHEFRDELFDAANQGEWNAKAEKMLLDIGNSEKHSKFTIEQAQSIIAKAKNVLNDVLAKAVSVPTSSEVLETIIVEESDLDSIDDDGLEVVATNAADFFAAINESNEEQNLQLAAWDLMYDDLSTEGE